MKTKWRSESENRDGSGEPYYQCQCPQAGTGSVRLDHLYGLCYFPAQNKLWFWDEIDPDSETVRMQCHTWEQAEQVKRMLTMGKSHWMEPNTN